MTDATSSGGHMTNQELSRFPISPQERRRSAASSDDVAQAPEETPPDEDRRRRGKPDRDKPDRPPHRRHERDQ
jgi:hypothetical protein